MVGASAIDIVELPKWLSGRRKRFAVDLRDPESFARGHVRGAINLQSGYEQFQIRAQRFFPEGAQLALIGDDPAEAKRLVEQVAARYPGSRWFDAPVAKIAEKGVPLMTQKTIDAREAFALLRKGDALLLDARTAEEYAQGHAPSAVFVYPDDFARQLPFLKHDKTVLVVCEGGWRSSLVTSYMDHFGFADARNLIGGMKEWRNAKLPIETAEQQRAFK